VGEILGAAVMPAIAGALADAFNLYAPMWMAVISPLVVAVISLFYVGHHERCEDGSKTDKR
jgi:fucose permease